MTRVLEAINVLAPVAPEHLRPLTIPRGGLRMANGGLFAVSRTYESGGLTIYDPNTDTAVGGIALAAPALNFAALRAPSGDAHSLYALNDDTLFGLVR